MKNTYPIGTRLVCKVCDALIATLKVERYSGDPLKIADFDFPGTPPTLHTTIRCPRCASVNFRVDTVNKTGDTGRT